MANGSQPTIALQNRSKVKPHSKYNYNYPCSLTLQSRDISCHIGVGQYCIHNVNPGLKFSDSDCYYRISFTKVKKTVKSVGITEYKLAAGKILSSHPKTRKLHMCWRIWNKKLYYKRSHAIQCVSLTHCLSQALTRKFQLQETSLTFLLFKHCTTLHKCFNLTSGSW